MTRTSRNSSNIAASGHDPSSNVMEIEFHGDCKDKCQPGTHKVYRYPDTSAAEHDAFVNAPSLGKHFSQFFRGRKFEKVAAEPLISEQWFSGR